MNSSTSAGEKSLITGASGFVGPHLKAHLEAEGDDVVGTDVGSGPDLRDETGWIKYLGEHKPRSIYHLAGWSDVGGSWDHPHTTFDVNVMGTLNVCEAARQVGVERLLIVSSAAVYGNVASSELPVAESQPLAPVSPYAASKEAAEAAALYYWRSYQMNIVIARPFNHIGPGQSPKFFAPAFAHQIARFEQQGGGTLAHGNLSPERDLLDVRDVVRAYRCLMNDAAPGHAYNICSGESRTIKSLLDTMLAASTVQIDTALDPDRLRPVDLPKWCGSNKKLLSETSWQPQFAVDETIEAVLDDARKQLASQSAL